MPDRTPTQCERYNCEIETRGLQSRDVVQLDRADGGRRGAGGAIQATVVADCSTAMLHGRLMCRGKVAALRRRLSPRSSSGSSTATSLVRALIHLDHAASARVAARAGLEPTSELVDGEVVWRRLAR
jgi:hypothetical protein